jgi:crotonobetainyl-CoA:carnitine CoA-transferase CaiB-like acyl-CoA transferase
MAPLPLQSVKVLDLSRVLAGPLCTMMLGDLGADVIKVERPGLGDETRGWGPPFDSSGRAAYYLSVNRNKLSIAADLRSEIELIRRLAAEADVVVENFLPGALSRAGLDATQLLEKNKKLIWCTISGFGAESLRPGYDFVVQAESGWMSITGEINGEPMRSGIAFADVIAGKDAAIAILATLAGIARGIPVERTVSISLMGSARAALVNAAQNVLVSGKDARRWGNAHANLVPYQLFHARDRAIIVAVGSESQWHSCVKAIGLPELSTDERFSDNKGRIAHREEVVSRMAAAISRMTAAECAKVLDAAGVPCGSVKTIAESLAEAGNGSAVMGMPPSAGGSARLEPPLLDQHGAEIRTRGWGAFSAKKGAV